MLARMYNCVVYTICFAGIYSRSPGKQSLIVLKIPDNFIEIKHLFGSLFVNNPVPRKLIGPPEPIANSNILNFHCDRITNSYLLLRSEAVDSDINGGSVDEVGVEADVEGSQKKKKAT